MARFLTQCFFLLLVFQIDVFCRTMDRDLEYPRASQNRIVGGEPVAIETVPYQVALFTKKYNFFKCGGSILNARTILTAAQCVRDEDKFIIRAGSADKDNGGQTLESSEIHSHPKYVYLDYDVAVIKLATDIKLDNIKTKAVKLTESGVDTPAGAELLVSGWGIIDNGGPSSSTLMGVKVPVVAQDVCTEAYLVVKKNVTDRMICASDKGKDSCQGDAGGPAVSVETGELVGVTAWGWGCAHEDYPGVYSKVAHPEIFDFINKHL